MARAGGEFRTYPRDCGLATEMFGEFVERGVVTGLGVAAACSRIGSVAERDARVGAVVVKFHSNKRGLVHPSSGSVQALNTCSRGASKMRVFSTS